MPGYSSGQRGQTVNLLAYAYLGSNPKPGTERIGRRGTPLSELNLADDQENNSSSIEIYIEGLKIVMQQNNVSLDEAYLDELDKLEKMSGDQKQARLYLSRAYLAIKNEDLK